MDKAKVPKTKGDNMNRLSNLVIMMMQDGVDLEVINDVIEHPTKYIQLLGICDGELVELPMYCFFNESLLTAEQKTEALAILDEHLCLWYAIDGWYTPVTGSWDKYAYPDDYDCNLDDDYIDITGISELMDSLPSTPTDELFLTTEQVEAFFADVEECPLDFI